ncbi:helix-turn-helix domain-containing protein [Paenibacillus allorhizosphaerae]|uniref:HTH-type transcriptional activator RhaR n=1 Tax=Paenibacillus allorhizosphaerae TaxID=2849866 RepID=A0ABN7TNF9_9BACL|nr:AraC family transcriptional regulator [Paenibacillus allorhizosphaerae]CAG7639603.1 HTH-type transcriptional activator RhaR [Paenibacillus allorhizosphaerae]
MGHIQAVSFLKELSLRLNWIIEWKFRPDEGIGKIAYPHTIIWLILGGRRHIMIREKTYEIKRGDLVVIPPHTIRNVEADANDRELFQYITVCCDLRLGSLEFVDMHRFPISTAIQDQTRFQELVDLSYSLLKETNHILCQLGIKDISELEAQKKAANVSTEETEALLYVQSLFVTWFYQFYRLMRPLLLEQPVTIDPRLQAACSYIERHMNQTMKIGDLARYIYISESHLRLLFRKTFGISPMEYLQQARMKRTKELLVNTQIPIRDIAEMIGYQNQNMFSRSFLKLEGLSAREYRKRYREEADKH